MVETGLRFERLRALFTGCCIVVPILVTITWLHYSSISYILVQFPNINILSAKSHNFTAIISKEEDIAIGMKDQSTTPQPGQKYESHGYTEDYSSSDDENNELLDGLLVSTFDRGSCLSRHESHLYRKASPHKPSQHLKSKLRHYEQLHRSCAACFSFIRNHSKSNSSNNHASATNCKCLIWTAVDGLGNRMLSLVSAFLYALLTDRVLLVKFESNMDGLFCEPFPNSSWLLPRDCSHKELSDLSVLHLDRNQRIHTAENIKLSIEKIMSPYICSVTSTT
ncbi:probable fucosyltransferase 8 [Neltuma alba]|uniref:probable fucosyltransferase 8 n=1 Tax=Neltuma alba TaxID=207710 RepID=UPI0010A2D942|nr:probable fucosyltransferase 8 [Prosopis alba]